MFFCKAFLLGLSLSLGLTACAAPVVSPTTTPRPTFDFSSPTPFFTATAPPRPTTIPSPSPTPVAFAQSALAATWDNATQIYSLRALDPHTGQTLPGYAPLPMGKQYWARLAPDKRTLAYIGYPSTEVGEGGRLHWVDLQTWTDTTTEVVVDYWPSALAYRPDGGALAFSYALGENHWLVEVAAQAATGQTTASPFKITQLAYTPDSTGLMLYGRQRPPNNPRNPTTQVALRQSGDLSELWAQALPEVLDGEYLLPGSDDVFTWQPAVAFAPGEALLYVVQADMDNLTVVDFAHLTITGHDLRAPLGFWSTWLAEPAAAANHNATRKQAAIAPDGQWLYVLGEQQLQTASGALHETLGLQVIDLTQRREIARLAVPSGELRWGANYRYLLINATSPERQAEVVNVETLQSVRQFTQNQLTSGFSQDGQPWLLCLRPLQTLGRYQLLNWDTLEASAQWPTRNYVEFIDRP